MVLRYLSLSVIKDVSGNNSGIRVLVTGGRSYSNRLVVWENLDWLHQRKGIAVVIEGGATGADTLAREWAAYNHVCRFICPADWDRYGKSAGPIRNQLMLTMTQPDVVVAFPGGSGTDNMVQQAIGAGVDVWHPALQKYEG